MFDFSWYQTLNQPPLAPPAELFSPVWTVIYITIALSLIFYATKFSFRSKALGYIIFFTQLALNFTWTPIFFGLKNIGLALFILILLDILVLFTMIEFFKVSNFAGKLLIPYFIWIIFATYLNIGIFFLN